LKLYFDANQETMKLGDAPKCADIANHLLSVGIYEGLPLAPVAAKTPGVQENNGEDGTPPASSWLLCKWRNGAGKLSDMSLLESMMSSYKLKEMYSRAIQPYDLILSKYDGSMYGFQPTSSYTVTFWYRPVKKFVGEIFNFGDSIDLMATEGRRVQQEYYSPSAKQVQFSDNGVRLDFKISTMIDRQWVCQGRPNKGSTKKAEVSDVLPFGKWTFVALSVESHSKGTTANIFYDNQMSHLQKSADASTGEAKVGQIRSCTSGSMAYVPREQQFGFPVSSYLPASEGYADNQEGVADVAGLTYFNKALTLAEITSNYEFEQTGVKGWSISDTKSSNNGVCGS
jgi:hypothetical protein